jgi:mycothione reductase
VDGRYQARVDGAGVELVRGEGRFTGCEMAAFFSASGTEIRLFTRGGRLLGREDHEIERVFQTEFEKHVATHCHATLADLSWDGAQFTAVFEVHGEQKTFTAGRVLFAIGRFMLQHAASFEVHYLRQKFLKGATDPIDERLAAHGVFSHPEVASVGFTEEQLQATGTPYVAVFEEWLASARAEAMRIDYPRVKLLVSPADHSILGCHLVRPESSTLLHQVMMLMRLKNDVRELANMIYIHPALNECLLAAAVKAVGEVRKFQTNH